MPHIWRLEASDGWVSTPLTAQVHLIPAIGKLKIEPRDPDHESSDEPTIFCHGRGKSEQWVLLAPPHSGVWINGSRVPLGIQALDDRDEIRVEDAEPVYFSTERLARVEPFPGSDKPVICPRCKQAIEKHSPAVCCPQCQAWFNESAELGCWTYAETCCCCNQLTALDAGYRWSPEGL